MNRRRGQYNRISNAPSLWRNKRSNRNNFFSIDNDSSQSVSSNFKNEGNCQKSENDLQSFGRRTKVKTFEDIVELLNEMLVDDYPDNHSEKLLEFPGDFRDFLNNITRFDATLSANFIKVVLKSSINHKLDPTFRKLLSLVLGSLFASSKIDSLISTYLPVNADVTMYQLLVLFLKLTFELLPGLAYDMYVYRVENLVLLKDIPYYKAHINENLALELEELRMLAAESCPVKVKKKTRNETVDCIRPPDDFRDINIFPTAVDLLSTSSKDVFLRTNKSRGAYDSVDHYLDVQFRLMHEDFIQPFREGLQEYRDDPNKRSFNVRVYKNVRLLNSSPHPRLGIIQFVQLDKNRLKKVKWSQSKRLIFGTLVCFSSDDFETLLFATVANRDDKDIQNGILSVKFIDRIPFTGHLYTMIETMNMFESYKHVLTKLQQTNETNLCMKKYLVFAETQRNLPRYVTKFTRYTLNDVRIMPGNDSFIWPQAKDLKLNVSQLSAFKSALTEEMTIIQGPPGTGKTYLGLKISSCLLSNSIFSFENFGPILVVCYTNHSLDQFLEGLLKFTKRIVRVGGQCESEELKELSIYKWKQRLCIKHFNEEKSSIFSVLKDLEDELTSHHVTSRIIIPIDRLRIFIPDLHYVYLKKLGIKEWLSGKSTLDSWLESDNIVDILVEEILYEELRANLDDIVHDILSSVSSHSSEDEMDDDNDNDVNFIKNQRLLEGDIEDIRQLSIRFSNNLNIIAANKVSISSSKEADSRNILEKSIAQSPKMYEDEAENVASLDDLPLQDRWRLYQFWRSKFINHLNGLTYSTENAYNEYSQRLNDIQFDEDEAIMKRLHIIGMTTTGAARYSKVLENIGCKIIIVEEAAEVLESHIIGSLNSRCQHLILMGDHKQLRPSPAVYRLATKYQLDLSLFERLINNDLNYNALSVQHRMRPEIADIIRFVYPDLEDSPSVASYPDIPSISTNIYFFNHFEPEESNTENVSYSNRFEAELIIKFCNHLLKNGIKNTELTILTLYSGQLFLLKSLMNKKFHAGVRVCVVDNFQGEENNVILLSLVRSNEEERIGFAGIDNRICVSLSRAKHGLYVFGNFDLLSRKSTLWKNICEYLTDRSLIGRTLNMFCQNHIEKNLIIGSSSDFDKYPDGGCEQMCNSMLKCGHVCTKYCHFLDRDHSEYECQYNCTRQCPNGHKCQLQCFQDCKYCIVKVEKEIPECHHMQLIPCYKIPEGKDCMNPCKKRLLCGHICKRLCGEKCDQCLTMVMDTLPRCGHVGEYLCSDNDRICQTKCEAMLPCDHSCTGTCSTCTLGRLHIKCCMRSTESCFCGHTTIVLCSDHYSPCDSPCPEACWHEQCPSYCNYDCVPCHNQCGWRCAHKACSMLCCEKCDRQECNEDCHNKLCCSLCGSIFECYSLCGEICRLICRTCDPSIQMNTKYITLSTCGHCFEVKFLDQYIYDADFNGEIVRRKCPTCDAIINTASSFRYMNVIKDVSSDIRRIHQMIKTERSSYTYQYYSKVFDSCKNQVFKIFEKSFVQNYFFVQNEAHVLYDMYYSCQGNSGSILVYKFTMSLLLLKILAQYLPRGPPAKIIIPLIIRENLISLVKWLNPQNRKFDRFEILGFLKEFSRIHEEMKKKKLEIPDLNKTEVKSMMKIEKYFYLRNIRWYKCNKGHIYNDKGNNAALCPMCR